MDEATEAILFFTPTYWTVNSRNLTRHRFQDKDHGNNSSKIIIIIIIIIKLFCHSFDDDASVFTSPTPARISVQSREKSRLRILSANTDVKTVKINHPGGPVK
jgi:hypothetical protein